VSFSDDDDRDEPAGEGATTTAAPGPGGPDRSRPALARSGAGIADGTERRPDLRVVTVDRLSGAIGVSILGGLCFIGVVVFVLFNPLGPLGSLAALAAWLVTFAALGVHALWWPAVRFRHTFYRVSDQEIQIRRGVLWRSVHSIPRSRIQHTDVSQGPIERLFELATLVIYTAGTEHASVSLGGLAHPTAALIRDHLIAARPDDGDAV